MMLKKRIEGREEKGNVSTIEGWSNGKGEETQEILRKRAEAKSENWALMAKVRELVKKAEGWKEAMNRMRE